MNPVVRALPLLVFVCFASAGAQDRAYPMGLASSVEQQFENSEIGYRCKKFASREATGYAELTKATEEAATRGEYPLACAPYSKKPTAFGIRDGGFVVFLSADGKILSSQWGY